MSRSDLGTAPPRARAERPSLPRDFLAAALLLAVTLATLLLAARLAPAQQHVAMGAGEERWLSGFHDRERNEAGSFRWTTPDAALFLFGFDGRPALVSLDLSAPRPSSSPPALLSPHATDHSLGSFAVAPSWRRYHLLVPTRPTGDTALILPSTIFRPNGDSRDLGVVLQAFTMRPTGEGGPSPERATFLVSLPLLAWLAFRHFSERSSRVIGWAIVGVLVLLVGWAAARPFDSNYLLPTFWWPWWPLVPLGLLIAGPALVRRSQALRPPRLVFGLAAGLIGLIGIRLGLPAPAGLALLALGVGLALPGLTRDEGRGTRDAGQAASSKGVRAEAIALVAITLLALGVRLYQLDMLPVGMWRDEARHALIALRIWQNPSYRPVYVVAGADLPALLFYLMAPVVGLLGPGVAEARLMSALAGGLTPLALWWAARPLVGARVALVGAALIAWASWSLSMSRWAFPATLDHLLTLTAVGLMWRSLNGRQKVEGRRQKPALARPPAGLPWTSTLWPLAGMTLAGVLSGLATYAYHTGRLSPVILAALTLVRLGWNRAAWRMAAPALAAAALAGLIVISPLLHFVLTDTEGYNRRTSAVAVVNSQSSEVRAPLLLLLRNVERYGLMWHVAGERNGRHHAPGAPMLDPVTGLLFALGLAGALSLRRRGDVALLIWLLLGLVPGLFSSDAPHAMRSLGALAPACMLAGAALDALVRRDEGRGMREEGKRGLHPSSLIPLPLVLSLAFNLWLYFGAMPRDPRVYGEFYVAETAMGIVAQTPARSSDTVVQAVRVFLPAKQQDDDVVRYLTSGSNVEWFDGARLSEAPGGEALVLLPPDATDEARAAALAVLGPGARAIGGAPRDPGGERPRFVAYGVGSGPERLLREAFGMP